MKRVFALALTLALVCSATASHADIYRAWKQLTFRTNTAATAIGALDSVYKNHTGAISDTTAPFTLDGIAWTPNYTAVDSIQMFDALQTFSTTPTATAAVVSTGFTLQGSADGGTTWDSGVNTVQGELLNGAGLVCHKSYRWNVAGGATPAATTNVEIGIYPLYRLILINNSGNVGKTGCLISYWKVTSSPSF